MPIQSHCRTDFSSLVVVQKCTVWVVGFCCTNSVICFVLVHFDGIIYFCIAICYFFLLTYVAFSTMPPTPHPAMTDSYILCYTWKFQFLRSRYSLILVSLWFRETPRLSSIGGRVSYWMSVRYNVRTSVYFLFCLVVHLRRQETLLTQQDNVSDMLVLV